MYQTPLLTYQDEPDTQHVLAVYFGVKISTYTCFTMASLHDCTRHGRGLPLNLTTIFARSYSHVKFQCRLGFVKVMLDPQEGPVLEDNDPQLRKGLLDSIQTYQEEEQRRPAFRSGQTPARYR